MTFLVDEDHRKLFLRIMFVICTNLSVGGHNSLTVSSGEIKIIINLAV